MCLYNDLVQMFNNPSFFSLLLSLSVCVFVCGGWYTDRLFLCIKNPQCGSTRWTLQAGIETCLTFALDWWFATQHFWWPTLVRIYIYIYIYIHIYIYIYIYICLVTNEFRIYLGSSTFWGMRNYSFRHFGRWAFFLFKERCQFKFYLGWFVF